MRSRIRQSGGSVMMEFAMTATVFLALVLSASQFALVGYRAVALNYVAASTMRWAILGKTVTGLNRVDSIEQVAYNNGLVYGLNLSENFVRVCPSSNPACTTEDAGTANSSIAITISTPISILFGGFYVSPAGQAIGTNEP